MSFNQVLDDQPQPEIARSAMIFGEVHVGAGAILAQGLVVRAHGGAAPRSWRISITPGRGGRWWSAGATSA